ncbi:MAG: hypothetical protein KAI81_08720 [Candidatus Marinimicrobia bacterium]|nr:hypothetical protein [Candidatus Neomarinimicrobiota bacterium]
MTKMLIKPITLLLTLASGLFADIDLKVESISILSDIPANKKVISYGNSTQNLLLTSMNSDTLWIFSTVDKSLKQIDNGGSFPFVHQNQDGSILYEKDIFKNRLRYSSLYQYHSDKSPKDVIIENSRMLHSITINNNEISWVEKKELQKKKLVDTAITKNENNIYLLNYQGKLTLHKNNQEETFAPSGEGTYIWTSLSPDKSLILYTMPSKGTFISDLNGTILHELGHASAPQWSYDGNYIVYMKDSDDGHIITSSDIYIYSLKNASTLNISKNRNDILLYPFWAPDSYKIICSNDKGVNIEFKLQKNK